MSFSLFSGDDERVPGADDASGDSPARSSSLPREGATEVMTEVIEADQLTGSVAGPEIEVGEGVELSPEELAAFDDELAAFDEALEDLSDEPPSGDVIDDSDVESLPPTEHDSDFNEEIQQWANSTTPPPAEGDEEAFARLDRASDIALAELDSGVSEQDVSENEDEPVAKFVPSRRRPDLQFVADDEEPAADSSPPPSSKGSLSESEPPSLRSLAMASVAPEPSRPKPDPEPGGDSIVFSSRGFTTGDVSAPPPASFFELPAETPKPAAPRAPARDQGTTAKAPPPRRRRPPASESPSPLPPPPREPRVGVAAEARDAGGDSVRTVEPPAASRTSPWLTHLVALLIGAAITFVLQDLRSSRSANPPDVPTRAPAPAADREGTATDREALQPGVDDGAEASDEEPAAGDEQTYAGPSAAPSGWEWPQPSSGFAGEAPEASASTAEAEPSAAEPSSEPASGEPGPFDPGAARSALGGLAVSASACGDGSARGRARVAVTFANSGNATVALIQGGPLSGTSVGSCIANIMRSAKVPAYSGPITTVFTTVVVK